MSFLRLMGALSWGLGAATLGAACFFGDDDDHERRIEERECEDDSQCAHLNGPDACYGAAYCDERFTCQRDFLQDDDACQCDFWVHCLALGYEEIGCNEITCEAHQCGEVVVPAGPSPDERAGDCVDLTCDGVEKELVSLVNLDDVDDDGNSCTVDTCTEDGPAHAPLADGDICQDGSGICYGASCYPGCVPENPEACGDEGPSEPANDDAFAASSVSENTESCGMLDGDDVDWYEMYIVDEEFETDILGLSVVSSAPTIEICAFVLCDDGGFPGGGCGNKQAGPLGSEGCCWTGAPSSLAPTWDLDCSDTSDDSGTVFYSVRAPSGGDCETYRVSAHY